MKKNKGFSLVELIIVIAIMAILVGILVPVLMHFIEKSNVSSDFQLADTIRSGMAYSIVDAEVKDDPDSQPFLQELENPTTGVVNINGKDMISITSINQDCVLKESLEEYIGCSLDEMMIFQWSLNYVEYMTAVTSSDCLIPRLPSLANVQTMASINIFTSHQLH